MTESLPTWRIAEMAESEIQAAAVKRLRDAGWFVFVTSQDKSTRRQLAGSPDVHAYRDDHALLIECKALRGKMRTSQTRFLADITPHCGPHLHYLVLRHPQQVDEWLEPDEGAWRYA